MPRFKSGQKVTKRDKTPWACHFTREPSIGPKFGEVVTVDYYSTYQPDFMCFCEYALLTKEGSRAMFYEWDFEPLISDEVLSEALRESTVPAELTPDEQEVFTHWSKEYDA